VLVVVGASVVLVVAGAAVVLVVAGAAVVVVTGAAVVLVVAAPPQPSPHAAASSRQAPRAASAVSRHAPMHPDLSLLVRQLAMHSAWSSATECWHAPRFCPQPPWQLAVEGATVSHELTQSPSPPRQLLTVARRASLQSPTQDRRSEPDS